MATEAKTTYKALAAYEAKGTIKDFSYTPIPLGAGEVEIAIHACGVCHSDLHQVNNDWKIANYPIVPGHEVIGEIIAVGSAVTTLKVGQRVGVSPQVSSCETCKYCVRGDDHLCSKKTHNYNTPTGNPIQPHTYGGFASHCRVNATWTFPIPESLPTIGAAPLLCAGITTWAPFVHSKVTAADKVGIIGVGGLGHLAVQFGVKLGCHTTGISTSANKKDEILAFGAQGFLDISDSKAVAEAAGTFDFLLATISANGVNWDQYLNLLAPDGRLVMVGAPTQLTYTPFILIGKRASISGSGLASNKEVRNMLDFCAKHNIVAKTEERDMTAEGANQALAKVDANTARYRMVLVNRSKIPAAAAATKA